MAMKKLSQQPMSPTSSSDNEGTEPLESTTDPQAKDILCGKGKAVFEHVGNRRFRFIIAMNMDKYHKQLTKVARSAIVRDITNQILSSGARFLKRSDIMMDEKLDDRWYVLPKAEARAKVSQTMRDAARDGPDGSSKRKATRARKLQATDTNQDQLGLRMNPPQLISSTSPLEDQSRMLLPWGIQTMNAPLNPQLQLLRHSAQLLPEHQMILGQQEVFTPAPVDYLPRGPDLHLSVQPALPTLTFTLPNQPIPGIRLNPLPASATAMQPSRALETEQASPAASRANNGTQSRGPTLDSQARPTASDESEFEDLFLGGDDDDDIDGSGCDESSVASSDHRE